LRVTGMFILQLQSLDGNLDPRFAGVVKELYQSILDKLEKQDIDQEVKQSSIIAMAQLVQVAHQHLAKQQLDHIVSIFGERLVNELTREATLKALTLIANNEATINIQGLSKLIPHFVDLMHKAQR